MEGLGLGNEMEGMLQVMELDKQLMLMSLLLVLWLGLGPALGKLPLLLQPMPMRVVLVVVQLVKMLLLVLGLELGGGGASSAISVAVCASPVALGADTSHDTYILVKEVLLHLTQALTGTCGSGFRSCKDSNQARTIVIRQGLLLCLCCSTVCGHDYFQSARH
ncbi:hypothetical protein SUGI_0494000, partial [Cryptomeria japonica]